MKNAGIMGLHSFLFITIIISNFQKIPLTIRDYTVNFITNELR